VRRGNLFEVMVRKGSERLSHGPEDIRQRFNRRLTMRVFALPGLGIGSDKRKARLSHFKAG
jgi:hypothetical protein